jgi:Domain of unknown function (DUF397)
MRPDEGYRVTGKPTVEELGIDVQAQTWQRSTGPGSTGPGSTGPGSIGPGSNGSGPGGAIEIAFVGPGEWVLMRVAGDPAQRVLVYDRFEWDCFLDGVKNGEFDDAAELLANSCK